MSSIRANKRIDELVPILRNFFILSSVASIFLVLILLFQLIFRTPRVTYLCWWELLWRASAFTVTIKSRNTSESKWYELMIALRGVRNSWLMLANITFCSLMLLFAFSSLALSLLTKNTCMKHNSLFQSTRIDLTLKTLFTVSSEPPFESLCSWGSIRDLQMTVNFSCSIGLLDEISFSISLKNWCRLLFDSK